MDGGSISCITKSYLVLVKPYSNQKSPPKKTDGNISLILKKIYGK